jgi:hypothetical protein
MKLREGRSECDGSTVPEPLNPTLAAQFVSSPHRGAGQPTERQRAVIERSRSRIAAGGTTTTGADVRTRFRHAYWWLMGLPIGVLIYASCGGRLERADCGQSRIFCQSGNVCCPATTTCCDGVKCPLGGCLEPSTRDADAIDPDAVTLPPPVVPPPGGGGGGGIPNTGRL